MKCVECVKGKFIKTKGIGSVEFKVFLKLFLQIYVIILTPTLCGQQYFISSID